jgi:hypothetical protein
MDNPEGWLSEALQEALLASRTRFQSVGGESFTIRETSVIRLPGSARSKRKNALTSGLPQGCEVRACFLACSDGKKA